MYGTGTHRELTWSLDLPTQMIRHQVQPVAVSNVSYTSRYAFVSEVEPYAKADSFAYTGCGLRFVRWLL